MTRYDDAQTHFDNLPDPRTLTPDEQIAHAQVAATLAQAEAIHAALDLLSHIGLAPDSWLPAAGQSGRHDRLSDPTSPPPPFRQTDPLLSDDAI